MPTTPKPASGFTLVEMVIATSILMVALALAMTGYVYVWSESNKGNTQDELDVQVQLSIESVKRDIRLSSLDRIYYYPPTAGTNTAISLALARDDDNDGTVDVDSSGNIIWDKTVIYHVWAGNPNQLRKTTFDPRDSSLSSTQFQAQLNSVHITGNGSHTFGASNATTEVIFQNLFDWNVQPQSSTFDGYAATLQRDQNVTLGSMVMSNGTHTFQFVVKGKNPSSSGYRVGIDSLYMSPSAGSREGEAHVPVTSTIGSAIPTNSLMIAGSWSGNHQLYFPATATGQAFTITMANDRWEETNFRATGELHDKTTVIYDTSSSPSNFVVQLDGNYGVNWRASTQTGAGSGSSGPLDHIVGAAVRVLIRGRDITPGSFIDNIAGKCWVYVRASALGALTISDIFIAEANVTNGLPTMNAVTGTVTRLRTSSGADGRALGAGGGDYFGYPASFPIDKGKSYLVTYLVSSAPGQGNATIWRETNTANYVAAYIIDGTNAPTAAVAQADIWSTRSDVYPTNSIPGVELMWGTYATNGTYSSAIYDTKMGAPVFSGIAWNAYTPFGTALSMKVRTGNSNDMSDAMAWTNATAMTAPGSFPVGAGNGRFVQFQANLRATGSYADVTPRLRDVTIAWPGETKVVDIGGTFTKGPDYGIFELLVDGQPLRKGVVINLEIYDYARAHGTSNRITSAATTEVTPRNTGR